MAENEPTTPESTEPAADLVVEDTVVEPIVVEPVEPIEPVVVDAVVVEEVEPVVLDAVVAPPAAPVVVPPPPPLPASEHVTGVAPVEVAYTAATPPQQVVYVQAPVPPVVASNRGIGALVEVGGAVGYAVVLACLTWVIGATMYGDTSADFLATWDFYIPVAVYAVASILLVLIVNRARWGAHVLGSLFVGAAVYFGAIGIVVLMNWLIWQQQDSFAAFMASPFYIVAAVLAREAAVWFGWIVAKRGQRVKERNAAAQAAFAEKLAEFHARAV